MEWVVQAEDAPPAHQLDLWRETLLDITCPTNVRADSPDDFAGTLVFRQLDTAEFGEFTATPMCVERTPGLIRRFDPEGLVLSMHTRGGSVLAQSGNDVTLRPGDVTIHDTSKPHHLAGGLGPAARRSAPTAPRPQLLTLAFSRDRLPSTASRLAAMRLAETIPTGALVAATFTQLHRCATAGDNTTAARLATVVLGLLTIGLAASLDQTHTLAPETRERGLVLRIKAFIADHLSDPELSPPAIAAAHYISLRYLHKVFEQQGSTVAEYIRNRRLEQCRRELCDPSLTHRSVGAVAARWGFTNTAHFNRLFRATHGLPPASYRRLHSL